jgi:23S rRNA pseudouridine1911/1915/1917 synthase
MEILINNKLNGKSIREILEFYHVAKPMIYKLSISNYVYVNGQNINFDEKLRTNDLLSFDLASIETNSTVPYKGDIEILYEDEDIIIINKKENILISDDGITKDTLGNRLSFYYQKNGMPNSVRPVHVLDIQTTGMVVFAKHFLAHSYLSNLIEERKVTKIYRCLCEGRFTEESGEIDAAIGRHRHENKQIVSKTGKKALTKYRVMSFKNNISKLEVEILEGRKHQIRVHLASIQHPIIGDGLYGKEGDRLMLHFFEISFIHPRTLRTFSFKCPEAF